MKEKKKFFAFVIIFNALVFFLSSCTPTLEIISKHDGSYDISYSVKLGKNFTDMILAMTGNDWQKEIFDKEKFSKELIEVGMKNVFVDSPSLEQINLSASIYANEENIFSKTKIISRKTTDNKKNTINFELSRNTLSKIYEMLPENSRSYIDLFMAPVFTDDVMTRDEYIELLSIVYGQPLADEIANAKVIINMASIDNANKKFKKQFVVSLVDLLIAQKPMNFSLAW